MKELATILGKKEELLTIINNGGDSIEYFNNLKEDIEKAESVLGKIDIKKENLNDAEIKEYKKLRTDLNKIIKFVEEIRKTETRKLDEKKKELIVMERELLGSFIEKAKEIKEVMDTEKKKRLLEDRLRHLPERRSRIEKLENIEVTDEELLNMNEKEFMEFFLSSIDKNNEIEKEKENVKKEIEEKLREEQEEKEKAEKEKREKEKEKIKNDKKLQEFLTEYDYNKTTHLLKDEGETIILYKKVAVFTK